MITNDEVIPLLLEACPSFTESCQQTLEDHPGLLYIVAGEFADHLLAAWLRDDRSEFPAVGALLEKLHVEGNAYVAELATIGFLEGIQNVWSNNSVDPEQFTTYLGPETVRWWRSLNRFWNAEIRYVGEDL